LPLFFILTACSEGPKAPAKAKEPETPPEPAAAQSAVQQTFVSARGWARDARLLRVANLDLKEVKSAAGKAGAWECTFVTEQRHKARRFVYSTMSVPSANLTKGVSGSPEDLWPPGGQTLSFALQVLKTDSTAAYEAAMKKSAAYAQKNPDMPIKLLLEWPKRFRNPVWRVIWGESVTTSNYSVYVDAVTGEYLQTAR